ncbi:MAG: hypothetical protein E5V63_01215 [Mesorhizobium sp.]|nr:MAG: hypothetical protein E5V63_01215 [Mesorhizobium sp.]
MDGAGVCPGLKMDKTRIVSLRLPDGKEVFVEISAIKPEQDVSDSIFEFSAVGDQLISIAAALQTTIAAVKPKSASVEFGIEIGLESGKLAALLVKGTGSANLKVTLNWES